MNELKQLAAKPWMVTSAYIAMLVVNGLAGSTTLIGGQNTAAVSDANPTLFTPAGFTFAIWGLIYILLGLYVLRVLGVIKTDKPRLDEARAREVRMLFTLSCIVNLLWIFAWQYGVFLLTILLMVVLLGVLIRIYTVVQAKSLSRKEALTVRLPFSVYFGWISVATVANIATALVAWGWDRFGYGEAFWMILTSIVATCIGLAVGVRHRDAAYMLVFVWAYTGILARHLSVGPIGLEGTYPNVIIAVTILTAVIASTVAPMLFAKTERETKFLR